MSDVIFSREVLTPSMPGSDYRAVRLMLSDHPHKIFITPQQRDDILEGFGHGFIIEINGKRIGCYWEYDNEFTVNENDVKTWNLAQVGIEPDMSSTNQFTNSQFFSSDAELDEAIQFIKHVFGQYDGMTSSGIVDDQVVMIWNKEMKCKLRMSDELLLKVESGDLVRDVEA